MTKFSLRRDFKHIQWGPTFQVMCVRAVGAAIVLSLLLVSFPRVFLGDDFVSFSDRMSFGLIAFGVITFAAIFIYPWIGLICWGLMSLFVKVEGKTRRFMTPDNGVFFLPLIFLGLFGGLGYLGITLLLLLGDPLTFALHRTKPGLVPVQKYNFLNFVPIVFVIEPEYLASLQMSGNTD